MRQLMKSTKLNSLILSTLLLSIGCAKDKPYDVEYKEEKLHPKSVFVTAEGDKSVEYIYVPSSLGTPMEVAEAAPFVQGQEKVVTLKWVEEGLAVYEVERDERFNENQLNNTPVLTIPGDYLSYRCREDAYGDCTNKEEENTELEWYQKDQFKPDFEEMKVTEVNTLDASLVDWSGCLSASSAKLVDYELSAGVINIELEKTYTVNKSNPLCTIIGAYYKDSAESSFDVRYFYSLVRLDTVASADYEAVEYPVPDQNDFGFFNDEELVLKDDFDRNRPERKVLMNRWNPNRQNNELVYYLSPEYSKPENKLVLDATYAAINVMNKEMQASQIPFTFKLIEQPDADKAVSPGDIRYNSLVLIEDPLANGLLGYGPSVKNPYTGEIIQAHTNMYLGVLKSMTRRVYEQAADLTEEEYFAAQPAATSVKANFRVADTALPQLPSSVKSLYEQVVIQEAPVAPAQNDEEEDQDEQAQSRIDDTQDHAHSVEQAIAIPSAAPKAMRKEVPADLLNMHRTHIEANLKSKYHAQTIHQASKVSLDKLISTLKESSTHEFTEIDEAVLKQKKKWNFLAQNNAFSEDFFPIAGTSKVVYPELKEITGILTQTGSLKRWDNLTNSQKTKVQNIILINSYKATLIHELGHNLGLRHNFMGSHDHENFFTQEEVQDLGLDSVPAYSSIMDYSFSEFNQLKAFGKYDLAALRFGYNREVELSNGKFMSIKGSLHEAVSALADSQAGVEPQNVVRLKSYEFCTDENTNLGNLCNRFDEGTTLVEITKHRIKKYKDNYKYRNLRDGRIQYSTYDMPDYIYARNYELGRIRDIMEDREQAKEFWAGYLPELLASYDINLTPEQMNHVVNVSCSEVFGEGVWFCDDYIDDGIKAVELAGNLFLDIIKTPDHLCALVEESEPTLIVEYRPLSEIYDDIKNDIDNVPSSCFDEAITDKVELESLKVVGENGKFLNGFKDTDPNFRYAQDRYARGIWPDKIYAMRFLFKRTSSFSTTDENFAALIDNPTIAEKASNIFSHLTIGTPLEEPLPFTTANGQTFQVPYVIGADTEVEPLEDYFSNLARSLRMSPKGKTNLTKLMLAQVERENTSYGEKYKDVAFASRNLLTVQKQYGFMAAADHSPEKVYFYNPEIEVTYSASNASPYAKEMITVINSFDFMSAQDPRLIEKIIGLKNFVGLELPDEITLTPGQNIFFNMNKANMEQIITLSQREVPVETINFAQILGPEDGALVAEFYSQGTQGLVEIYNLSIQIFEMTVAALPDTQRAIMAIDSNILISFLRGGINEELIDFYIKQLSNMPEYAKHQDATF